MKEYIAKDDLLNKLSEPLNWCDDDFELGCSFQYKQDLNCINELPTLTKSDICREFVDHIKALLCVKDEDYDKPIISPKYLNDYLDQMFIDGLYEMRKEEVKKDCNNCANSIDDFNNEVDTGCYMCCKGFENNYIPINTEDIVILDGLKEVREYKNETTKAELFREFWDAMTRRAVKDISNATNGEVEYNPKTLYGFTFEEALKEMEKKQWEI